MSSALPSLLQPLAQHYGRNDKVVEVSINGPGKVWVELAGSGYEQRSAPEITPDWAWDLCTVLANSNGLPFTREMPILACRLPGGHRFQAVLGDAVAEGGMCLSVRIKRKARVGIEAFGLTAGRQFEPALHYEAAKGHGATTTEELLGIVRAGGAVLISGGTSTGKTTLLNQLVREIPLTARVVTVEDTREIELPHENRVHFVVSRIETGSHLTYARVIDAVVRLNPGVVICGELSVDNAYPILRLLNTGHESFLATLHANNPLEALEAFRRNVELGGRRADGVIPFLTRSISRVVQVKKVGVDRRQVSDVVRPSDLPWRRLVSDEAAAAPALAAE